MNKAELIKKLYQIKKFAEECLKDLGGEKIILPKIVKIKKKTKGIGPTKSIEELIEKGFFDVGKRDLDVLKELKKRALICKRKDAATVLRRFVRKNKLSREGEGRKGSSWKYKKVK